MYFIIEKKELQYNYPMYYSVTLHNNRPFFTFQIQLAERYKTREEAQKFVDSIDTTGYEISIIEVKK